MRYGHTLAAAVRDEMGGELEALLLAFLDPPASAASTRPEEYCSEAEQSDTIYSEGEMRHHHGARMVAVTAAANAAALEVS